MQRRAKKSSSNCTQKNTAKPNQYVLPENPFPNQPNYSGYDSPTSQAKTKNSAPVISQNNYSQGKDTLQTSKVYSSTSNLDLPPLPQNVMVKASKPSGESKARTMLDNGDTDAAIKALEGILEKNPDSPEAHYLMGKALGLKNNLFGAIKHLEEAIRVNEKYYDAYYLLGKDYAKVNLMEDAIKNYLVSAWLTICILEVIMLFPLTSSEKLPTCSIKHYQ